MEGPHEPEEHPDLVWGPQARPEPGGAGGAQVQCPWICAFLCFRFTLGREEVLADRGLEFGSPKEEKSPKASSVPVRPRGWEGPSEIQRGNVRDPGTQRPRNGAHPRYLIMEILAQGPGCSFAALYFEQVCGDSQPGHPSFSNTNKSIRCIKSSG